MVSLRRLRRRSRVVHDIASALQEARKHGSPTLRALAERVRAHKLELAAAAGPGKSCAGCTRGIPDVPGCFDGGLCCSGSALDVFSEHAIAALALGGTRAADLRESHADAGCAFRGERGCTLAVEHRPAICVHYICRDLMAELSASFDTREIGRLQDHLATAMREFADRYDRELGDREFDELLGGGRLR